MLQSRVIQVGRIPVRYGVAGRGSPLVLIHGLAASRTWWRHNVPALEREHTVYVLDLPGCGSMRAHHREFALERAPEWVRSVLQALGLERPSLVGHSMGGTIALSFAARWPNEVERLVLAAPAVSLPHRTVFGNVLPFLAALRRTPLRFAPTLAWDAMRTGPVSFLRAARTLTGMTFPDELPSLQTPTLLVWGSGDVLVPRSVAQSLSEAMPACELCVIDGGGHVVMVDRPDEFNRAVLGFLAAPSHSFGGRRTELPQNS